MGKEYTFDVVVVGAGIAGMVTAVRAAERGLRVGVIEKGNHERYPCNSRMTGGAFHVAFRDVMEEPGGLLQAINNRTRGFARPELAQTVAQNIGAAVQWLKTQGVKFIKVGHEIHRQHTLAPPILLKGKRYWEGRGGDVLLRTLHAALSRHSGVVLLDTRAVRLRMDGQQCVGLDIEEKGEAGTVQARNVVLCDGGFQANLELMKEFVSPAPEKLKQRNAATGNGDGLRMAREIGAQLTGMDRVYGHLLSQDAMTNDELWPFPILDFVCTAGLVVDRAGCRFMDEGLGGVYMVNRLAKLADPLSATVVFDEAIWHGPGREFISPANPLLLSAGGTVFNASGIGDLACQLGLPQSALERSVTEYNDAVQSGATDKMNPARTIATYKAYPIAKPPYHAVRLCAGVTYTMGGLAVDGAGRVLDLQNKPITGLRAAGCATGGLEGGEFAGYVGGLTKSASFAFRIANELAAERAAR